MNDYDAGYELEDDFDVEIDEIDDEDCGGDVEQLLAGVRGARLSGA